MKPESLHALIIDRHFGELSPEAEEMLDHHLSANAAARTEAERILKSMNVTRDAVLRHPELACVPVMPQSKVLKRRRPSVMPWLARAAAMLLLAAVAGAGGFVAGRSKSPAANPLGNKVVPRKESPWARYRMSFDPAGEGLQVVRVDVDNIEKKSLP